MDRPKATRISPPRITQTFNEPHELLKYALQQEAMGNKADSTVQQIHNIVERAKRFTKESYFEQNPGESYYAYLAIAITHEANGDMLMARSNLEIAYEIAPRKPVVRTIFATHLFKDLHRRLKEGKMHEIEEDMLRLYSLRGGKPSAQDLLLFAKIELQFAEIYTNRLSSPSKNDDIEGLRDEVLKRKSNAATFYTWAIELFDDERKISNEENREPLKYKTINIEVKASIRKTIDDIAISTGSVYRQEDIDALKKDIEETLSFMERERERKVGSSLNPLTNTL